MRNLCKVVVKSVLVMALAACQNSAGPAGVTADSAKKFDMIGAEDTFNFAGTEPFWGGEVTDGVLRFVTPEDPDGQTISVKRFAGMNGLGFNGRLNDNPFDMAVTPGDCSDGMSESSYPFIVMIRIGDSKLQGCGWTEAMPVVEGEGA